MKKTTPMRSWARWVLLALAAAMVLAGWMLWLEPSALRLVEHRLPLQHWPAPQNGLRIAVITDLHVGAPFIDHRKVERIVAETNAAQPDLILLAGDFVIQDVPGGEPVAPEHIALWLAGLRAPLGVYAVLGNHDNVLGAPRMRNAFAAVKIPLIDESSRRITQGRFDFWLIGLADYLTAHPEPKKVLASVDDSAPVIAVAHNPDVMPMIDARVNLLIAGHTHGGQVRLPFYGALETSSEYGKRYEIGHIVEQTDLYVCPGIGTSILPIRFLDPPEICMLTLTGTDPSTPAPTASR